MNGKNIKINISEIQYNARSGFDKTGHVFEWKGKLLRGIYKDAVKHVLELFNCGLINKLVKENLIPETSITGYVTDDFPLIIEHEYIKPLTYSFEWTFTMLKDAAFTVLKTNEIAQKFGYQLKDAHGGNIMFKNLRPFWIDIGSFTHFDIKQNYWIAYSEFKKFYLYSLSIWSKGDEYTARRFMEYGSMDESAFFVYKNSIYRLIVSRKLHLKIMKYKNGFYSFDINKIELNNFNNKILTKIIKISIFLIRNKILIRRKTTMPYLSKRSKNIKKKKYKTYWDNYHNKHFTENNEIKSITKRFNRLVEIVNNTDDIKTAIDIAGNKGVFSQILGERTNIKNILTLDYDANAVDEMYIRIKNKETNINAIVLQNLILPVKTRFSLDANIRFKSDAVFALALTHHLLLTQNYPIDKIFEIISSYSNKYVFIEFMPLGLWGGKTLPVLPDWYTLNWFRNKFKKHFEILHEEKLDTNRIIFLGKIYNIK